MYLIFFLHITEKEREKESVYWHRGEKGVRDDERGWRS